MISVRRSRRKDEKSAGGGNISIPPRPPAPTAPQRAPAPRRDSVAATEDRCGRSAQSCRSDRLAQPTNRPRQQRTRGAQVLGAARKHSEVSGASAGKWTRPGRCGDRTRAASDRCLVARSSSGARTPHPVDDMQSLHDPGSSVCTSDTDHAGYRPPMEGVVPKALTPNQRHHGHREPAPSLHPGVRRP